jgi:ubiquitin carboxyl-terminal hydrolase 7
VSCTRMFQAFSGFDIATWKQDPATTTPATPKTYRALKATSIGDFVARAAEDLDMDPKSTRAWVVVNRQNGTARPDSPIRDSSLTLEEVGAKMGTKALQLRLWLEETPDRDEEGQPLWGDSKCKLSEQPGDRPILIFLKHFDVEAQTLYGAGTFYMALLDKVQDMKGPITKMLGWPADANIELFEEIKVNMIDQMKVKQSLQASEIQEGDIVCVQKKVSEKQEKALTPSGKLVDAISFYDMMLNRIKVHFLPRVGVQDETTIFELELSKKMSYQALSTAVGEHLGVDPTHVRFYPVNMATGRPKAPLRHTTAYGLSQMLSSQPQYNQYSNMNANRPDSLFYEIMEFSLAELEMRKTVVVYWISEGIQKEVGRRRQWTNPLLIVTFRTSWTS